MTLCPRLGVAGITALVLVSGGRPVASQESLLYVPLDSATAVRLHLANGRRVTGRLVAPFGPDSTRFAYCPGVRGPCATTERSAVRVLPAAAVTAVDTRRGSRATRGALLGALAAAGGAAAFCALTDTGGCDPARGGFFSYVLLPTTLAGAGVGALIGGSISVWARAP